MLIKKKIYAGELSSRHLVAMAVGLALGTLTLSPVVRADDVQEMSEVTITGAKLGDYKADKVSSPKYTAPLRDIPRTLVVIPQAVFAEQGATTLTEVLRNTPGITMLAGEGGGASSTAGDSFFMRGFDATNSVFIDGVRDQGAYARDVFNLDQVEVSKGPSGSYSGRGNASGSVNLVTKTPLAEVLQMGSVRYGTSEHKRATLDINQPLAIGPEGTAVRFNALWQDGGVAGRDHVQRDAWGVAPSIVFGLGTDTRVSLAAQILRQDNLPDYGMPTVALPGVVVTDPPVGSVDQNNFYGLLDYDFEDINSDSVTLHVAHDFVPGVELSNLTRYSENDRLAVITTVQNAAAFDPLTGLVTRSRQSNERENRNLTNQTNLRFGFATGKIAHTFSSGLEFTRERQFNPTRTGAGTAPATDLYAPNPHDIVTDYSPARIAGDYTRGETKTAALYAFDTIGLSKRWQLDAGVRIERYETEFLDTTPATGVPPALDVSDTLTNWNVGLVYKPVETASVYLSAATTQTPPGGLNFTLSGVATNANNPAVAPQKSCNYELGTKWDLLEERLGLTAAVFRAQNTNVVTTESIGGVVVAASFDGKQRVDGIELGLSGQLTERWQAFGGFAYLDSEFTESVNSIQQNATLQWTPRASGNLWTTYRLPYGLSVGGGVQYMDTVERSTTALPTDAATEAPNYWLYNATAAWQATPRMSVRLNVNNLSDEVYSSSLNNNGGRYNPGAGRSWLLGADFRF